MDQVLAQKWTNKSVRAFARGGDPIALIEHRPREVVLEAMDKGWSGPPFDPVRLANLIGISVQPQVEIIDARTVPSGPNKIIIEYNPQQAPERIRFSVAHEIAHTFFPDCAEKIRTRTREHVPGSDEWQLEMLCNIAASELIMPLGSFLNLREQPVVIEELMRLRSNFQVSAEAILIRVTKLTHDPLLMFCASPQPIESGRILYRLDYTIPSRAWTGIVPRGLLIGPDSVLNECTGIGFTSRGTERWNGFDGGLRIQCVGLPPYPGDRYPRVAGFVRANSSHTKSPVELQQVYGSALEPRGSGPKMICHIVTDAALVWGGQGFAAKLRQKFPAVQDDFRAWVKRTGGLKLGNVHFAAAEGSAIVASMVAQHGFGPSATPRIRYGALTKCLEITAHKARDDGASVHMPLIGTGQAGGSWELIKELITRALVDAGLSVTAYELPPSRQRAVLSKTAERLL